MKFYVAGPMRGVPAFNFPAFDSLAAALRGWGHGVANPAEHDREVLGAEQLESAPGYLTGEIEPWAKATGFSFATAMQWDLRQILDGDAIVLLPGWEASIGARYERMVAEAAGKEVWLAHPELHESSFGDWYMTRDPEQHRLVVTLNTHDLGKLLDGTLDPRVAAVGEVRVVDPETGGAKGSKLARFDLIPVDALWAVAEQFGRGAQKYEDRNWEKGYAWGLSHAALHRHLAQFWGGEDVDEETGGLHMAAVAWHALALLAFVLRGAGTDTRPGTVG